MGLKTCNVQKRHRYYNKCHDQYKAMTPYMIREYLGTSMSFRYNMCCSVIEAV